MSDLAMYDLAMYEPLAAAAIRRYRNDARGLRRSIAEFEKAELPQDARAFVLEKLRAALAQLDLPLERERAP